MDDSQRAQIEVITARMFMLQEIQAWELAKGYLYALTGMQYTSRFYVNYFGESSNIIEEFIKKYEDWLDDRDNINNHPDAICKNCVFYAEGFCRNPLVIGDERSADESEGIDKISMLNGGFGVGANFGCIHWARK